MASRLREFGERPPSRPEKFMLFLTEGELGQLRDACMATGNTKLANIIRGRMEEIFDTRSWEARTF